MKVCTKCEKLKEFINFHKHKRSKDGYACRCKECSLNDKKDYYKRNKDRIKGDVRDYRDKNIDVVKKRVKDHYDKNRDLLLEYKKDYHIKNKKRLKDLDSKWRDENRERIRNKSREYISNKRNTDVFFKLKDRISGLIRTSIVSKGYKKLHRTETILGCSIKEFKEYIEIRFTEGMSWENHGEWHLDHKTPVSWAKTESEIYDLNHYSNFQPLWSRDNLSKGNRWRSID